MPEPARLRREGWFPYRSASACLPPRPLLTAFVAGTLAVSGADWTLVLDLSSRDARVMSPVLYLTLAICAVCAGLLVYRHDLYEREKPSMLGLVVVLGVAAMWLAGRSEAWTFDALSLSSGYALAAFAAVEEELLKMCVVVAVALLARRQFNDPMDGIVYGSMAGLGMAIEESLYYMNQLSDGGPALPTAELVRILGHLVMGGISGYGVSAFMLRHKNRILTLAVCFASAIALHFGWDWIALSSPAEGLGTAEAVSEAALMLGGLVLYGSLTTRASRQSHDLFAPASPQRLWGWPFTQS